MKSKIFLFVLMMPLWCLLVGCSRSGEPGGGQDGTGRLNFSFRTGPSGGSESLSESNDPKVNHIRVMVFGSSGVIDVNKVYNDRASFDNISIATRTDEQATVVVVANEASGITDDLNRLLNLRDFDKVMQPSMQSSEISSDNPFDKMLVGIKKGVRIAEDAPNNTVVTLHRAYAKVSLTLKKFNAGDDVRVKSIKLLNLAKEAPLSDLDSYFVKPDKMFDAAIDYSADNLRLKHKDDPKSDRPIFENFYVLQKHTDSRDIMQSAPMLSIDASFDGIDVTYRAYINPPKQGEAPNKSNYAILRNHHYILNGMVKDVGSDFNGMLLTTTVADWTEKDVSYKFADPYLEKNTDLMIDGKPYEKGKVYRVSKDNPIKIRIKVTSANKNAIWKANLTDALYFRMTGGSGVVRDGLKEFEMVPTEELTEERHRPCKMTFVVDGKALLDGDNGHEVEVDFLQVRPGFEA